MERAEFFGRQNQLANVFLSRGPHVISLARLPSLELTSTLGLKSGYINLSCSFFYSFFSFFFFFFFSSFFFFLVTRWTSNTGKKLILPGFPNSRWTNNYCESIFARQVYFNILYKTGRIFFRKLLNKLTERILVRLALVCRSCQCEECTHTECTLASLTSCRLTTTYVCSCLVKARSIRSILFVQKNSMKHNDERRYVEFSRVYENVFQVSRKRSLDFSRAKKKKKERKTLEENSRGKISI